MTTNVWLVQVITPAFCRTVCDDVNRDVWKFITETTLLIVSDLQFNLCKSREMQAEKIDRSNKAEIKKYRANTVTDRTRGEQIIPL